MQRSACLWFLALLNCALLSEPSRARSPAEFDRDPAEAAWVREENAASRSYLSSKPDLRRAILERDAALKAKNPPLRADLHGLEFFVSKGSLVLAGGGEAGADRTVIDVANLPRGSAVTEFRLSPDRAKLAYGYAVNGTDWTTWKIVELASGVEVVGPFYIKSSGVDEMSWDLDSAGLYYEGWGTADEDLRGERRPQIRFHRLGSPTSSDAVVFQDDELPHTIRYHARALDDQSAIVYRLLGASEVPLSAYVVRKLPGGGFGPPAPIVAPSRHWGRFAGIDGSRVLLRTSKLGPTYGVVAVDLAAGPRERTIVPARAGEVLLQAQQIGDALVLQYLDARLRGSIRVVDLKGRPRSAWRPSDLGLPDLGAMSLLSGGPESRWGDFTHSSVVSPTETLRLDVRTGRVSKVAGESPDFDGSQVQVQQAEYTSADGTRIPIQVYSRKDVAPSFGYVYAYGSIGIPNLPTFNRKFQLALEMGGVVALPGARGGGERGLNWQQAGVFHKWKTFEDIAWASRWLKRRFPSIGDRVAMAGRSYGGLATMAEYAHFADDFAAYVPVVAVSDPVSLLTQEQGWGYWDDFGFRRDESGRVLYERGPAAIVSSFSPLNAIPFMRQAKPLMAFSGQHDTRISSNQTIRFIRALRAKFGADAPVRMIEHENIGHNGRAEAADEATFLALEFGIESLRPLRRPAL